MPINWDEFDDDLDTDIADSIKETDEALANKVSSLTRMTDEEVKALFPKEADVKKLSQLMKIVKSAEDRNSKINAIVSNAEELGGVILTLIDKFA